MDKGWWWLVLLAALLLLGASLTLWRGGSPSRHGFGSGPAHQRPAPGAWRGALISWRTAPNLVIQGESCHDTAGQSSLSANLSSPAQGAPGWIATSPWNWSG